MAKRARNNAAQSLSTERLHPSLQASFVPLPREGVTLTPEQLSAIFGGDLRALHEVAHLARQCVESSRESLQAKLAVEQESNAVQQATLDELAAMSL